MEILKTVRTGCGQGRWNRALCSVGRTRLKRMRVKTKSISRVVGPRGAPVSWLVMHLPVKLSATLAVVFRCEFCAGVRMPGAGLELAATGHAHQARRSSSQPAGLSRNRVLHRNRLLQRRGRVRARRAQTPSTGFYFRRSLAKVRYDTAGTLSLGAAYDHMKEGRRCCGGRTWAGWTWKARTG